MRANGDAERIAGIDAHFGAADEIVDAELAEAIERTEDETGDYLCNLHVALSAAEVGRREFGLVCSAVSFLARARQAQSEQERLNTFEGTWLGEVDEIVTVTGEVTTCMIIDGSMPGSTQVLALITTDTSVVKIVTAARWAFDEAFQRGSHVTVKIATSTADGSKPCSPVRSS